MAEFTVSEVIDGDTFKVKNGGGSGTTKQEILSVQLVIITPEENERGDEEAKRRLSNLILNKTV